MPNLGNFSVTVTAGLRGLHFPAAQRARFKDALVAKIRLFVWHLVRGRLRRVRLLIFGHCKFSPSATGYRSVSCFYCAN
jgi:hypothetical protein